MNREIAQSYNHRYQRRRPKPADGAWHKLGIDPDSELGITLFHCRREDQIEEIEQADPDNAEDEMQPAERHHFVGVRRIKEGKVRAPLRKRNRQEIENHWGTSVVFWIGLRKYRSRLRREPSIRRRYNRRRYNVQRDWCP